MIIASFELVTEAAKADALQSALVELQTHLETAPGLLGFSLMRYSERPYRWRVDERWQTPEAIV